MLDEAPMKQKWIQWANIEQKQIFANCFDDEERRRQAISLIKKMKENKIHHGRKHLASNKVNALPENMLIYLWLLRYMIHDEDISYLMLMRINGIFFIQIGSKVTLSNQVWM